MRSYRTHIETGLGTKRAFQGGRQLLVALHVLESAEFAIFDGTLSNQEPK